MGGKRTLEDHSLSVSDFRLPSWPRAALGHIESDLLPIETRHQHTRAVILLHAGFAADFRMELQVGGIRAIGSDDCIRSIETAHRRFDEDGFVRSDGRGRLGWKRRLGDRHKRKFRTALEYPQWLESGDRAAMLRLCHREPC